MMKDDKKQQFWFRGVFYDKEEEFFEAIKKFGRSSLTSFSAKEIMEKMIKDVLLNINHQEDYLTISNDEFKEIIGLFTLQIILKYRKLLSSAKSPK